MQHWLNPRALVPQADLDEIYRYEDFSDSGWLYPEKVLEHWGSNERWIPIPEPVQALYQRIGRASPITRARALEQFLGTDCHIYFKREDMMPNGSFKICSALPQAYYGAQEGRWHVITETGAGQTGAAAALASTLFGLDCTIFMVRTSYDGKPLRRKLMEGYGAEVHPSPSDLTALGRQLLAQGQDAGSIAVATSEVYEQLRVKPGGMNIAGSLLDFVLTYNTVVGLESLSQLEALGLRADTVIGCVGGGGSFGGLAMPFIAADDNVEIIATESDAVPTLTQGRYDYDYPDGEGEAKPLKMYSLGYKFQPPRMHASGLRYHAASPIVSYFVNQGRVTATAYSEQAAMQSAVQLARLEGMISSPESSYTIHAVMEQARACTGTGKVILGLITGSGHLDLDAYSRFFE